MAHRGQGSGGKRIGEKEDYDDSAEEKDSNGDDYSDEDDDKPSHLKDADKYEEAERDRQELEA